jgi:hypothetical protein
MFRSDHDVKRHPDITNAQHWNAVRAFGEFRSREVQAAASYAEGLDDLQNQYLADIRSLSNDEEFRRFEVLHRRRVENMREVRKNLKLDDVGRKKLEDARIKASTAVD